MKQDFIERNFFAVFKTLQVVFIIFACIEAAYHNWWDVVSNLLYAVSIEIFIMCERNNKKKNVGTLFTWEKADSEEESQEEAEEYYLYFSTKAIDENNNTIDSDGLTCINSSNGCSFKVLSDKIKETIEERHNRVLKSIVIVSLNEISKGLYHILNNKKEINNERWVQEVIRENPNLSPDHCSDEETNLAGRTIRIPHKCDFCPNETANCKKIYIYGDSEAVCVV